MGLQKVTQRSEFNSADIAKYIYNRPEADLIIDMYRSIDKEGYEKFFQGFIDASQGSAKIQPGIFNRGLTAAGNALNYFNKLSDNFYKKAAFSGELSRLTKAHYGMDLTDMIRNGQFNKIDPKLFNEAMDKAFELLYQKTPKGTGWLAQGARGYLNFDKRVGFISGLLIPFPRFVINQIQFMYEHVPLLGMLPLEAVGAKGGTMKALKEVDYGQKFAKTISGSLMIGAFYSLRKNQGAGTEWYNAETEDGRQVDLRPFLGPMNLDLYLADLIMRHKAGEPMPMPSKITKEMVQTAIGSSMRAGTGLYLIDQGLPELLATFDGEKPTIRSQEWWGRLLGDYLNTYTINLPTAVARDLYSLTDEQLRLIPETKGEVDTLDVAWARAGRSLGPFQDNLEPRYDIFRPEPTRKVDPLRTAITGLNISQRSNEVEKEMTRLQLEPFEIYRGFKFGPADVEIRRVMSQRLPQIMSAFIRRDEYKNLPSDERKTIEFIRYAKEQIGEILRKPRSGGETPVLEVLEARVQQLEEQGASQDAIKEELGYHRNDINQFLYENSQKRIRRAVEEELGAPTDESNFAEYYARAQDLTKQKFAIGGMPTSALDRTLDDVTGLIADVGVAGYRGDRSIDEQMDELSLDETATVGDEEETQSLSGVIGKIAEVGGEVWDNMNYLDRAALVTAPVPVVGDVTGLLADAYMYATKPEERTAFNYALTGASVVGALPASVTKALGSSPVIMGIMGSGSIHKPEATARYKKLMAEPLTKEQEKLITEDPEAIAKIMEEKAKKAWEETGITIMEGTELKPRFEIDDSGAQLKNLEIKQNSVGDRYFEYTPSGNILGDSRAGTYGRESYGTVGDILDHQDLYDIYPEAKNIPLAPIGDKDYLGYFGPPHKNAPERKSTGVIGLQGKISEDADFPKADLKSTLLHELQHYVQFVDELNSGGSATDLFLPKGFKELKDFLDIPKNEILSTINQHTSVKHNNMSLVGKVPQVLINGGPKEIKKYFSELSSVNKVTRDAAIEKLNIEFASDSKLAQELKEKILDITSVQHEVQKIEFNGYLNYRTIAGEAEARLVQDRRAYTPEMRKAEMPSIIKLLRKEEVQSREDFYKGAGRSFTYPYNYEDTVVGVRRQSESGYPRLPVFNAEYIERVTKVGDDTIKLVDKFKDSKTLQESVKIKYKTPEEYDEFLDKFRGAFRKSVKEQLQNKDFDVFVPPVSASDELWDAPSQKITSADTSMNVSKLPKGYTKLKNIGAFKPGQRVVDIGGGRFDNAVEDLAKQDVELLVYDPFNRTAEHNKAVVDVIANGGADVAVSNNTLNVIEETENIKRVIQQAENAIKPGDKAYFTVYAGNRSGKGAQTSKGYQRNEPTSAYVSRVEEVFGEGNVQSKGDLITATKPNNKNRGGLMSRK
jgi:uncharacterized UPF0146 family protein